MRLLNFYFQEAHKGRLATYDQYTVNVVHALMDDSDWEAPSKLHSHVTGSMAARAEPGT